MVIFLLESPLFWAPLTGRILTDAFANFFDSIFKVLAPLPNNAFSVVQVFRSVVFGWLLRRLLAATGGGQSAAAV